ncbi:MAG: DUF2252 domain-containing protein [Mycolicibacterium insubricum]|nr:DUF2252 domain-containing protein [Mycobacterium sp.]
MPGLDLRDRAIAFGVGEPGAEHGRALRKQAPRTSLAELIAADRTATEILVDQNRSRLPELVGLRFARMLVSPLSFYRGAAAVMAADLAAGPTSNIEVMSCGDAHLSNFGVFATPDRALVFDLNDFDEAAMAPAEWDLKRLVTSAILGARQLKFPETAVSDIANTTVVTYRDALTAMMQMSVIDRFYLRAEPIKQSNLVSGAFGAVIDRTVQRARKRTSGRAFAKLTEIDADGIPRFRESPPMTRHVPLSDETELLRAVEEYMTSVAADARLLLAHFRVTDIAMRVVGVGSIGTRCYLAALVDSRGTPLILQIKEAKRSVLQEYGKRTQLPLLTAAIAARGEGRRVVIGQRILQSMSDRLLGTVRAEGADFYLRQFHDMKGSVDLGDLNAETFAEYAGGCAAVLARAHAQSANAEILRGYFGGGSKALDAVVTWCYRYADKTVDDFDQLTAAARDGDIEVAADPQLK